MKMKKSIYRFLLAQENQSQVKLFLACLSSFLIMGLFYFSNSSETGDSKVSEESAINLSVMIPEGYVLFGFEAENYEQISTLLEPYNMVRVYSMKTGQMLAKNIKVLRAPKDPSQLSFLVPVNIANYFAHFGLEYRIVLQKYDGLKSPQLIETHEKRQDLTVTYGGLKSEDI